MALAYNILPDYPDLTTNTRESIFGKIVSDKLGLNSTCKEYKFYTFIMFFKSYIDNGNWCCN